MNPSDRHGSTADPTQRLLRGFLLIAPLTYLAADSTYAAKGWDDATGGVLHVLGAIAYGFAVLAVAAQLPRPHDCERPWSSRAWSAWPATSLTASTPSTRPSATPGSSTATARRR